MDRKKKQGLEAAGWKFGDAADFLNMNETEREVLNMRVELALAVRRLRKEAGMTQKQLAGRMKTSQPRVAKIEHAAADVLIDQMLQAITAVGGRLRVKQLTRPGKRGHNKVGIKATEEQPTSGVLATI